MSTEQEHNLKMTSYEELNRFHAQYIAKKET